jgi:hypothetical protein
VVPEGGGIFGAGRLTVSPGYFMLRREVIFRTVLLGNKSEGIIYSEASRPIGCISILLPGLGSKMA